MTMMAQTLSHQANAEAMYSRDRGPLLIQPAERRGFDGQRMSRCRCRHHDHCSLSDSDLMLMLMIGDGVFYCSLFLVIGTILILKVIIIGGGILILLVLRYEIVHIALSLSELHLVHSLSSVPVEECFTAEHCRKLLRHSFEHILNGGGVADEGGAHLESARRNIANRRFHVIRDPLHEVRCVLVLDIQHLLVHFLRAHPPPEQGRSRQISSVTRIGGAHHVL